MTIEEKVVEIINDYVSSNGTASKMTPDQLYSLVNATYPMNRNSFLPADYCYNRTNEGIDFEKHSHLFERTDDGNYLVLGGDYPYSGPVYYRRRGEKEDSIRGVWTNGLYEEGTAVTDTTELRLNDLFIGVKNTLKSIPVTISADKNIVYVSFQELLVCGISVEEEVYKIFNATSDWAQKTTYHCDKANDGTWFYYLETIDECIGEVKRLVLFEEINRKNKISEAVPVGMTSSQHREWVESIIGKLAEENPSITYRTDTVKDTPISLDDERVMDVYYRKDAVRINVKFDTKQYQIYKDELPKDICYQKDSAAPDSTGGVYAFFVDDANIELVLRKLLIDL